MDTARSSAENSPSTAATTPELPLMAVNDDIWGSDDETLSSQAGSRVRGTEAILSDLPVVKRQHMTDGYREGLAIGKAKIMQKGFDQGYPVGIQVGLRSGKILGALEGVVAAKGVPMDVKLTVDRLLAQARQELLVSAMLKDVNDEILMASSEIPTEIESTLQRWEQAIFGETAEKVQGESEGLF